MMVQAFARDYICVASTPRFTFYGLIFEKLCLLHPNVLCRYILIISNLNYQVSIVSGLGCPLSVSQTITGLFYKKL